MYENNNTVSIDWKGLFIKIIVVALIVFAIFKGYEYLSNKNTNTSLNTNASQLFNANLESLRQAGENYYDYKNLPSEDQTVMITLGELISKGYINELVDDNGNVCSRENSYVSVNNEDGQYRLKATLACGDTTNFKVNTIGCDCEENNCSQNKEEKEEQNNQKAPIKEEIVTKKKVTKETTKENNIVKTEKITEKQQKPVVETTNKTTTKTTIKTTNKTTNKTTTTKYVKTYKVEFDSNGGTSIATQYVEKYETAKEPNNPYKNNATFVGWYYNGRLWDFDTEITRDIKLEAYYWETKTIRKPVYSAAWDAYGTTYLSVSHKLLVPAEIKGQEFKNQRIKKIENVRTMYNANDLYNHVVNHKRTFDYIGNGTEYQYNQYAGYTLGRVYNINVRKTYSYKYDTQITWTANVSNQCTYTIDGANCNYGIVYYVVWEYQEFTK